MLSPHYFHVKLDTAKGEIIQKTFQHGVGGYCALWVNVLIAPDTPGVSSTTRKRTTNGAREKLRGADRQVTWTIVALIGNCLNT